MIYLVTTNPHRAPQEVEAPVARAAAIALLKSTHESQVSATVYVRTVRASKWDVFSCIWNGTEWWTHYIDSETIDHASEIDALRAELREERAQWQETLRAERERVRTACVAACRRVESEHGDPYEPVSIGREEGAAECAGAIAALDLDALPENAPSR